MLVYAALNLPFLTWILMGFFKAIPVDLEWAALTDGATAWGAFWRIVLPVSLPGLAAAGVLGFILSWNEFLFALVLSGPSTQPFRSRWPHFRRRTACRSAMWRPVSFSPSCRSSSPPASSSASSSKG